MRSIRQFILLPIFLLMLFSLKAQLIAVKAGKLIEPETGKILQNQIILIEGKKIKEVGANITIPQQASIIDLTSYTIMPGLFDAHTHLCAKVSIEADRLGIDLFDIVLLNPPAYRAIQGVVYAKQMLEAGFTTVRDAGNAGQYVDVELKRAIDEGLVPGPNMVVSGKIISPFGGQFRTHADKKFLDNDEYLFADTHDELRKAIRENIYYGANVIKIVVDGQKYQYSKEDIQFIVNESAKAGLKVMAHCQTKTGEKNAAEAGVASIEHGWNLKEDVPEIMKRNKVVLVSTDFTEKVLSGFGWDSAGAKRIHEKRVERLKRAYMAGVTLAFGTDVMIDVPGETRGSLAIGYIDSFVEAGVPAKTILQVLTTNPAKLLGVEMQRGAIRPGMFADLIATQGNPLENVETLKDVSFVMKNGIVYKNIK